MRALETQLSTLVVLAGLPLVFLISGCASTGTAHRPEKLYERGGVSVAILPGNSNETYFTDTNSVVERICRTPSPDYSLASNTGFVVGAMNDEIGEDASTSVVSLGGRNPAVLISRDLLYRACELTTNLRLPPEQTIEVYERFLQTIEKVSQAQVNAGSSPISVSAPGMQVPSIGTDDDSSSDDEDADSDDDDDDDD